MHVAAKTYPITKQHARVINESHRKSTHTPKRSGATSIAERVKVIRIKHAAASADDSDCS